MLKNIVTSAVKRVPPSTNVALVCACWAFFTVQYAQLTLTAHKNTSCSGSRVGKRTRVLHLHFWEYPIREIWTITRWHEQFAYLSRDQYANDVTIWIACASYVLRYGCESAVHWCVYANQYIFSIDGIGYSELYGFHRNGEFFKWGISCLFKHYACWQNSQSKSWRCYRCITTH